MRYCSCHQCNGESRHSISYYCFVLMPDGHLLFLFTYTGFWLIFKLVKTLQFPSAIWRILTFYILLLFCPHAGRAFTFFLDKKSKQKNQAKINPAFTHKASGLAAFWRPPRRSCIYLLFWCNILFYRALMPYYI